MTLSLSAPSETYVGQVEVFDARTSTGVSKMPLPDGSPPFEISYGDGYNANLLATGHSFRNAGSYSIKVTNRANLETLTKSITVRDIPEGTVQNLTSASGLQAAINLAASRNTVEQTIIVPAGMKIQGTIFTPKPIGDKYITIRSSSLNLLPLGKRVTPADEAKMFQVLSISGGVALQAAGPGSHHYRFQGMKVGQVDSRVYVQSLVYVGLAGSAGEKENLAHHFIFERCWFDGGPNDTDQIRSGLEIWGDYVSLLDSRFAEFRRHGAGVDSQGFGITVGQGPYSFINNYIVATSESVNLGSGGAAYRGQATVTNPTRNSCTLSHVKNLEVDMNLALKVGGVFSSKNSTLIKSISGNNVTFDELPVVPDANSIAEWELQPSFIEFRGNHCFKPLKWFPRHPSWNGITYQIKNLYETKFSRYTVNDGNIYENSWIGDQSYAIAITPRNGNGGESIASVVREMQWSNNIIKNAAAGFNVLSSDYFPPYSQGATDITFRNILFWNVGRGFDSYGSAQMMINLQNAVVRLKRIFLVNITYDHGNLVNNYQAITDFGETGGADESVWINFLGQDSGYGIRSNTHDIIGSLKTYFPPGDATNLKNNLIVNTNNHSYPPGFVVATADWRGMFVDYANGDFTLKAGAPGKGAGTNGKDVGVDMAALKYATRGCISGVWDGSTAPDVPPPPPPPPVEDPPPPPPPPPTTVNPSPDGTKATTITDSQGAVWTISPTNQALRNGSQVASGTMYKYLSQSVYLLALDSNWHKWTGSGWTLYGPTEPGVVIPPPPPPLPSEPAIGALKKDVPWTVSEAADNAEAKKQAALGYYFKTHQTGKKATFVYTGVKLTA